MKSRKIAGRVWLALATSLLIAAGASTSWAAADNTKSETGCHSAITKAIGKQIVAITKAMAECENAVLANPLLGPCPDTATTDAINSAAAKAAKTVTKKCQSTCVPSGVSCIASAFCPPNGTNNEACEDFEIGDMGFPGPRCVALIGRPMIEPEDVSACGNAYAAFIADDVMTNVYGDLSSPPSEEAASCLAAITKALPKSASKLASTVAKCRNTQLTMDPSDILPNKCSVSDPKTADSIASGIQKFKDAVAKGCTEAAIDALSLCGAGIGGTPDLATAQECLSDVLEQVSYSVDYAENRDYATIGILNGAYPKSVPARCGDNLVNQQSNQFLFNGEECDGTDDSACPGECFEPGDLFECTCKTARRSRSLADGFNADLDNGWSGKSHNAKVTDRAGFVVDVANCDCDLFDPIDTATCVPGHSVDPVCDITAESQPRCEDRIGDGTSCNEVGNQDLAHTNEDCNACDEFSINSGEYCTGSARYCYGGTNSGDRCNKETDCTGGGTCSGIGTCVNGPFAGNGCNGDQNCGICLLGTNAGNPCALDSNCPLGTCEKHKCGLSSCIGGDVEGNGCSNNTDCTGGGRCAATSDCVAQCYDSEGTATSLCAAQEDCADGEICRGQCDKANECVKIRNGAPLPISAAGTSVCIDSQFFTNIVGTRNILTGEHAINYDLRSLTHLAEKNARPCPVCGGFCAENDENLLAGERCEGTCSGPELACRVGPSKGGTCTSNADCGGYLCTRIGCRFDDDCCPPETPGCGETCSGTASPECAGTDCSLDLVCAGGQFPGKECRLEAYTAYGTTSTDCAQLTAKNISASGLAISWTPLTSGTVSLEQPAACDAPGFQNYDCNCVTGGGGTRNKPNNCKSACNDPDPAYYGRSCAPQSTDPPYTTCVGGGTGIHGDGRACDEDSDCTSGDCGNNPRLCGNGSNGICSIKRCVGGTNAGEICIQNGQCPGGGSCPSTACVIGGAPCAEGDCDAASCAVDADCTNSATCDDSCPAGRCVPLCLNRGKCTGGERDGQFCALDKDCVGGGTCLPDSTEEGACANASFNHCDGPGWEFISCGPADVNTTNLCEAGTDNKLGNANGTAEERADAADNNIGAGYCRADIYNCFVNDGTATGGGDPTHSYSVATFCIPTSNSSSVDPTAGLPGPGRIRQPALNVPNYTQLP